MDNNTAQPDVWTVKQLRDALAQFPDDLPLAVNVPGEDDDSYDTFAVTAGPGYPAVNWGDGQGLVDDLRYVSFDAFAVLRPLRDQLEIEPELE